MQNKRASSKKAKDKIDIEPQTHVGDLKYSIAQTLSLCPNCLVPIPKLHTIFNASSLSLSLSKAQSQRSPLKLQKPYSISR